MHVCVRERESVRAFYRVCVDRNNECCGSADYSAQGLLLGDRIRLPCKQLSVIRVCHVSTAMLSDLSGWVNAHQKGEGGREGQRLDILFVFGSGGCRA